MWVVLRILILVAICLRYGIVLGPHGLLILPSIAISRLYAVYVLYLLLAAYAMLCGLWARLGVLRVKFVKQVKPMRWNETDVEFIGAS